MIFFLAQTFYDQGQKDTAFNTYNMLIDLTPKQPEAFKAQVEIMSIYHEREEFKKLWEKIEYVFKAYARTGKWARFNKKDFVDKGEKKVRELALYYPKKIHQIAQKSSNMFYYDNAFVGYLLYLKLYPKDIHRVLVLEYLGDIDYFRNNYYDSESVLF